MPESNGCSYERVSKDNAEWKICYYDGTVNHPDGVKWACDDTKPYNDATTEQNRILTCPSGEPGREYIYMADRGAGGYLGIYVYTTSLDGDRLTAMVQALNACTGN